MATTEELPSYNVEFLPLERRLLDRRAECSKLAYLLLNRRAQARRFPNCGGESKRRATDLQKSK